MIQQHIFHIIVNSRQLQDGSPESQGEEFAWRRRGSALLTWPKWSSSIIFLEISKKFWKNQFSNIFFGLWSPRTRFFEDFQKNMIFDPKPYFWGKIYVAKLIFWWNLIFKLFLFLENLQNGFFTFLISFFNQKLKFETYIQFFDFHDFYQQFLNDFYKEVLVEIVKIRKFSVRLEF